jgi:hypothetical protein
MSSAGAYLSLAGAVNGMIGAYYSAKSQKSALKFAADMSAINARMAESQAQSILAAGRHQAGMATMRAGMVKSTQTAAQAANGVDLGVGSAAEVRASTDILKEIDKNTIEANATRSAWGARTQSVNYANQSLIQNASASGINPAMAAMTSMLTSGSEVASSWYRAKYYNQKSIGMGGFN